MLVRCQHDVLLPTSPQCTRPSWRLWRPLPPTLMSTTTCSSKPSSKVVCPRWQRRWWGPTLAGGQCGGGPGVCPLTHWVFSPPGTDSATPLTKKKFISHATCHDSLELQEQETYLIMGQTSDLWRVKSECVGASCCPRDAGLGPLTSLAQPLVSESLLHLSAGVLGFKAALNGGAGLYTAQVQGTAFTQRRCRCRFGFLAVGSRVRGKGTFLIP